MRSDAATQTPTLEAPSTPKRVAVLLPLPLSGAYDYAVPLDMEVPESGRFVAVPLGRRGVIGVVWDTEPSAETPIDEKRLKPIEAVLDAPAMPAAIRKFVAWVAAYALAPPGAVLRMAMSVPTALEPPPPRALLRWSAPPGTPLRSPGQRRVAELLADGRAMSAAEIAEIADVSTAVARGLAKQGALETVLAPALAARLEAEEAWRLADPALSSDQATAAAALRAEVTAGGFSVTLLDGVTGSGKTEVYFDAIAAALEAGRTALVLLPEIALSAQWLERFEARFGRPPTLWHSELTGAVRRATWRRIAEGRASVVVGARSALFLPLDRLGVVVVDEEHDGSFKQEEGVIYQARDMAIVRARLAGAPVVLASATPSLETLRNVELGRYRRVALPDRHGGASLPTIERIDLRKTPPPRGHWLSPPLADAVAETLARGEQTLLFLNRRGYAPLTLCRACGHRITCPQCAAWMVEHRLARRLVCHHCGLQRPQPKECSECGAEESMVACGPGVERLAEEIEARFPDARRAVMASDIEGGPAALTALIEKVAAREIDILIGTQMVAKGHHFPHLTLVGVVDADLGLGGGDFRAGERTFQLLNQVGGRAGRAADAGRVLLQTTAPDHPVMAALASGDRDRFNQAELLEREDHGLPPYGRMVAIIVSAPTGDQADTAARALARSAPRVDGVTILGPAPAPLAILRGRHRRRLLLKARREVAVQGLVRAWLATVPETGGVRVTVDVDPYSFM